jgi:hypothetical protein
MSEEILECEDPDGFCQRAGGHEGQVRRVSIEDVRSPFTEKLIRNICERSAKKYPAHGFKCVPTSCDPKAGG